jgi:3-isopropylmalate/(R)-2-methylmalate dehydratase large subunit
MNPPRSLFEKLWQAHEIRELAPGVSLLHVDRHIVHDMQSAVFAKLSERGLPVRNPDLTFCVADHAVSSMPLRAGSADWALAHVARLREAGRTHMVPLFDADHPSQGIAHIMGPELGLTLPGMLIVCGDSHTSTHGALGALALGIGTTEAVMVLATQAVCVRKPRTLLVRIEGQPGPGVEPKDIGLALIRRLGTAGGTGHAIEYAGDAIRAMDMDGRLTICNLSIEMGANCGMVSPDDTTLEFVASTPYAPKGTDWTTASEQWRQLASDSGATFDRHVVLDAADVQPQISWGTSPEQTIGIGEDIPEVPAGDSDMRGALSYMGLTAGSRLAGTAVDHVFIGSCTNARLSDLRRAAEIVRGHRISKGTSAWVVPGSQTVKRAAEAEGLADVFRSAGFEWREPGCSMCAGTNGDILKPGQRCVSTSNRNFMGRQGPGVRTHLAGAAVAAMSALLGRIPTPSDMTLAAHA